MKFSEQVPNLLLLFGLCLFLLLVLFGAEARKTIRDEQFQAVMLNLTFPSSGNVSNHTDPSIWYNDDKGQPITIRPGGGA